ncbi:DUF3828 domain-containing protein [Erwinia sp.]|uniref:DUF3828 domain-containing protein n=1 Tax=Erwinia citreus TaxID=558 RepID=UPI00289B6920|nr:DUF3828 domain-containing protein [Erwinia sp.]
MRALLFAVTFVLSASAFASAGQDATHQAREFYKAYLTAFSSDNSDTYPLELLEKYVAADTVRRLNQILQLSDQDVLESDYFTYSQDYDPSWIPTLKVEDAKPSANGDETVQVYLGIEDGKKLHLEVFMKPENNYWKIYRVRDVTNKYESRIFDDSAIKQVKE